MAVGTYVEREREGNRKLRRKNCASLKISFIAISEYAKVLPDCIFDI